MWTIVLILNLRCPIKTKERFIHLMMMISVQAVGVRHLPRVRVHHLCDDPDQHPVTRHEVLSAAGALHAVP